MRERASQMEVMAKRLEMDFSEEDEWGLMELVRDFRLFRRGGRKRVFNILRYSTPLDEIKVNVFDYRFVVSTGKSARRYYQTVFFVQSKELALPEFWMKPEGFFHKVGNLLGMEDINFEEHPDFSEQYYLTGEDEELIRHTFNKDVLHYFTVEKDWSLEGVGYFFILYKRNVLFPPRQIKGMFERGVELWKRLA